MLNQEISLNFSRTIVKIILTLSGHLRSLAFLIFRGSVSPEYPKVEGRYFEALKNKYISVLNLYELS